MKQYTDLVRLARDHGRFVAKDRTGTGTYKIFGAQLRFPLGTLFPIVTEKFIPFKLIVDELLWFLSGSTNNNDLVKVGCHIWDEWAIPETMVVDKTAVELNRELGALKGVEYGVSVGSSVDGVDVTEDNIEGIIFTMAVQAGLPRGKTVAMENFGDLGPIYGKQWRFWETNYDIPLTLMERLAIYDKNQADLKRPLLLQEIRVNDPDTNETITDLSTVAEDSKIAKALHQHFSYSGIPQYKKKVIDQVAELIEGLKSRPFSRRHIITAWNVGDLPDETQKPQDNVLLNRMALAPCHGVPVQFDVSPSSPVEIRRALRYKIADLQERDPNNSQLDAMRLDSQDLKKAIFHEETRELNSTLNRTPEGMRQYLEDICNRWSLPKLTLSCQMYQRSADLFLGVPFNISSYALLTRMIAQCVDMNPGEFVHTFGDTHIYSNHLGQVDEMLQNEALEEPTLWLNPDVKDIFSFTRDDIKLIDYKSHGSIKAPVAV